MASLLTLAEAKEALNITSSKFDTEVWDYAEAATDMIEERVGPIIARTVTETLAGRDTFVLSETPVLSVTSIVGVLSGAVAYNVTGLTVNPDSGVLRRTDRGTFGGDLFTVTYQAGRSGTVPARFKHACRVLLQHLWTTQRITGGNGLARDGAEVTGTGYSWPNRVLEMLITDVQAPGIA